MRDSEFIELALRHIDQMYRLAYARLGNKLDAEDVVQDTYLQAFRSFNTLRSQSNFKTWLTRILLNSVADHYRKANRGISTLNLEESIDLDVSGPTVAGPEESLCISEAAKEVRVALSKIPEQFAIPLLLREFHDATYEDISEILDIPKGTVMSRLFRGRAMLKDHLSQQAKLEAEREANGVRSQP